MITDRMQPYFLTSGVDRICISHRDIYAASAMPLKKQECYHSPSRYVNMLYCLVLLKCISLEKLTSLKDLSYESDLDMLPT